jgi:hypothetical protein
VEGARELFDVPSAAKESQKQTKDPREISLRKLATPSGLPQILEGYWACYRFFSLRVTPSD